MTTSAIVAVGASSAAFAPAASVQAGTTAPGPSQDAAPLWVWAVLGGGVVSMAASGVAAMAALRSARRAGQAAAAHTSPVAVRDARAEARLDRVEAWLRELSAAQPARCVVPPATTDAPPPPDDPPQRASGSGHDTGDVRPRRAAEDPAHRQALDLAAWNADLARDFAEFAADPAITGLGFLRRRRPRGAALAAEGAQLLDAFEGAKLWAVRAPGEPEVWALTPGEAAVLNWSAHFAPQRDEVAAEVFGAAFDLVTDGSGAVRLLEPALLRRDAAGRLAVRRRGRLGGFRS